jgi:hypothetical protein
VKARRDAAPAKDEKKEAAPPKEEPGNPAPSKAPQVDTVVHGQGASAKCRLHPRRPAA